MDIQALMNSIASGPPPNVASGVTRVPVPQINLGGIGPVAVPQVPIATPAPVVPGKPIAPGGGNPYGIGGVGNPYGADPAVAAKLGNLIPAAAGGAGNIIGTPGPAGINKAKAAGTMQIAGPRDDRTMVANLPTSTAAMLADRTVTPGLTALANAVTAGGGQLGTGMLSHAAGVTPAAPHPLQQQNDQMSMLLQHLSQPPASAANVPRQPVSSPIAQSLGTFLAPKTVAPKPVALKPAAIGGAPRNR